MKSVIQTFLRAAAVAGLALLAGCAGVSTTQSGAIGVDRTQYMSSLVPEQALVQEAGHQYAEIVQEARAKGLLDRDPAQLSRVRAISQRLIAQTGVFRADAANWPWEVHVLSVDEVNAWCMPGGKIAVYTGLLAQIKPTDDELAAVLGHEIAHALREHARERVSQQMATSIGLSVLSMATGSPGASDLGGKLTEVMFTLPNSRTHETRPIVWASNWPRAPASIRAPPSRCGRKWARPTAMRRRSSCPPTRRPVPASANCSRPRRRYCRCTSRRAARPPNRPRVQAGLTGAARRAIVVSSGQARRSTRSATAS